MLAGCSHAVWTKYAFWPPPPPRAHVFEMVRALFSRWPCCRVCPRSLAEAKSYAGVDYSRGTERIEHLTQNLAGHGPSIGRLGSSISGGIDAIAFVVQEHRVTLTSSAVRPDTGHGTVQVCDREG